MSEITSTRAFVERFDFSRFENLKEYIDETPIGLPEIGEQIALAIRNAVHWVFRSCWQRFDITEDDIVTLGRRFWNENVFGELLSDVTEIGKWIEGFRILYGEYKVQFEICDGMLFERWAEQRIIDGIVRGSSIADILTSINKKKRELIIRPDKEEIAQAVILIARDVHAEFMPMYMQMNDLTTFLAYLCGQLDVMVSLSPAGESVDVACHMQTMWGIYKNLFLHYAESLKMFFTGVGVPICGAFDNADEIISAFVTYYQRRVAQGARGEL